MLVLLAAVLVAVVAGQSPHERAVALVKQMTLDEKIQLVHGNNSIGSGFVGYVPGIERLNIPGITMNDGPQGFRGPAGTSTQFPSGMTVAHAWDRDTMRSFGRAMGDEFRAKGCAVQFGPGVNLARLPWGGRNFEYLAGEDPFLGSELAFSVVDGVQSAGVIANVKHFFNNNQENNRHNVSENVDERTQMEIYMPAFEGAVRAGVLSAMCANNKINQVYSCENAHAIQTLYRGVVNFTGFMCSDYKGTRSTVDAANHGLDIQMPGCVRPDAATPLTCDSDRSRPNYFGEPLKQAVQAGTVPEATLDAMVTRTVRAIITSGFMEWGRQNSSDPGRNVTSPEHNQLVRELAMKATIVLQDTQHLLPLKTTTSFAVIGAPAKTAPITGGGGSGAVTPYYVSTIFDAVRAQPGIGDVTFNDGSHAAAAAAAARAADVAIVVLASSSHEGADRANISMPDAGIIAGIAAANPRTIVVVASPGAFVPRPWMAAVPTIVATGMSGQEQGNGLADVLFFTPPAQAAGCPCGRLPYTLPNTQNEIGFTELQFPGINNQANYTEGLNVGYRWYATKGVKPAFAFGHGLAYTTFGLRDLSIKATSAGRVVQVVVANTGARPGRAVVQLYIKYPAGSDEPPLQLRGFDSAVLQPTDTHTLQFVLAERAFSVWSVATHAWEVVHGQFTLHAGFASDQLLISARVTV